MLIFIVFYLRYKYADEVKKKSLVLKIPKDALAQKKRKQEKLHCDYLNKPNRSSNRRCTDPLLALSDIFESILNEMRSMPEVHPFIYPVNIKVNYLTLINIIIICLISNYSVYLKNVFYRMFQIITTLLKGQWTYKQ